MTEPTPEWEVQDVPIPDHSASKNLYDAPLEESSNGRTKSGPTRTGSLFRASRPAEKRAKATKSPPPENRPGQFIQPLEDLYTLIAVGVMPFKPAVSMTILGPAQEGGEKTVARNCAEAWDELAQKNESVRRALKTLTTAGVYGAIVMAHAPIAMAAMQGTEIEKRFNPAAAMEDMLRKQAEEDTEGTTGV